jgi:CRISPR-associated endonuclease Cas3-HD
MDYSDAIAHVAEDGRIHPLKEHLVGTAECAARFAEEFGCAGWGRLAGLWHDLGKYSPDFQKMIRTTLGLGLVGRRYCMLQHRDRFTKSSPCCWDAK